MNHHSPDNTELSKFRQRIDVLDDKIIALMRERIGIIQEVGVFKDKHFPGQCPIRAGREAEMLRRVMNKFEGSAFAPAAAAAMWRVLIGYSTSVESTLTLSVYTPDRNDTLYWLAREYFGPTLPIIRQPHIKRVIGDVTDGKASVGIVPTLHDDTTNDWWPTLLPSAGMSPKVFAHIPFVYENTPGAIIPAALAIGRVAPEATGNDVSFIVLDTEYNVSQHRLQTALTKLNLPAHWVSITSPTPTTRRHLIEIKSFVYPADDIMKALTKELDTAIQNIGWLGAYAAPVILNTQTPATTHAAAKA